MLGQLDTVITFTKNNYIPELVTKLPIRQGPHMAEELPNIAQNEVHTPLRIPAESLCPFSAGEPGWLQRGALG